MGTVLRVAVVGWLLVSSHGTEGMILRWVIRVLARVALRTTWIILRRERSRHVVGEPSRGTVSRLVRARTCLVSRA